MLPPLRLSVRRAALAGLALLPWIAFALLYTSARQTRRALERRAAEILPLSGHLERSLLTFSWKPGTHLLTTVGSEGTAKLWDADSGRMLDSAAAPELDREISPDGRHHAVIQRDRSQVRLEVRDAQNGHLIAKGVFPEREWNSIAWSPDGTWLAICAANVQIWSVRQGDSPKVLPAQSRAVAWSPDSQFLATATWMLRDNSSQIEIWRVSTAGKIRALQDPNIDITTLAWSPDAQTIAAGGCVRIDLLDASTSALRRTIKLTETCLNVSKIAWSPDGSLLAAHMPYAEIWLWTGDGSRLIRTLVKPPATIQSLSWSPDGRQIATGTEQGDLALWERSSGSLVRSVSRHQGPVLAVAWNPNGKTIAAADWKGTVLWNPATGEPGDEWVGSAYLPVDDRIEPRQLLAWSADGGTLAFGPGEAYERTIQWTGVAHPGTVSLGPEDSEICSLAFSPKLNLVATGRRPGLRLWDPQTGTEVRRLNQKLFGCTNAIAFSPDGRWLAAMGWDSLVLWQRGPEGFTDESPGTAQVAGTRALAWSPDSRLLASAHDDGGIRLWHVDQQGRPALVTTLRDHGGAVRSIAWSPNGRILASGGDDALLRMWNVEAAEVESNSVMLGDGAAITWLPRSLLYDSFGGGHEMAILRTGGDPVRQMPLSAYRDRLHRGRVREHLAESRPDPLPGIPAIAVSQLRARWVTVGIGVAGYAFALLGIALRFPKAG